MEIILVRHTTPNIEKGICYGQADIGVIDTFLEEVQPILKEVPLSDTETSYYSSPLKRCKLLAEQLSDTIIFDDRLKELDFGDWELKKWDDINKPELDIWMNDFVNITVTNGESYIDLHNRTVEFLNELKSLKKQRIVIVTHAGVIRSLWAYVNNISLENSFDLKLKYGDIIKFTL
ncbi:alpha-ribazole phosphatase [Tenacibaculum dicentrarchi]|nr:alpha-ribazole phosphatase [Tenacibaculum dicentrarchi]MCD8419793.1 alpha-ribazole phosphatase [Tenacibaculum dicentrarchi]MCD8437197.1 alpha-ribazole phosphatase [Tenacibaculum dicentrarchi]MCD8452044.1 alpha-ribazole phosphatase [Tenacibaculum dicentrarchi]MCG8827717.1 alpha-ribazole phosphatase [Tenacibaculum dicentrarchi]